MTYIPDATDYSCRYCGEGFEPGDEIVQVWRNAEIDEEGAWEGQDSLMCHEGCVSIKDNRPDPVRYFVYDNADGGRRLHLVRLAGRSYCGSVEAAAPDVSSERAGDLEGLAEERGAELCSTCAASFRRDR